MLKEKALPQLLLAKIGVRVKQRLVVFHDCNNIPNRVFNRKKPLLNLISSLEDH